jgi:hypothetical protein
MRWIGGLALAVCVSSAFALYYHAAAIHRAAAPPPATSSAWHWASAQPGMNIYYAYRASADKDVISVWVDRRLFSNPAGINKDLLEAWNLDCRGARIRSVPEPTAKSASSAVVGSDWSTPRPGTARERLLRSACSELGLWAAVAAR